MGALFDTYVKSYCLDEAEDAEFFDLIRDLYYSDEVQSQKQYHQHSSINRLDHVRSVTFMSYTLAKKFGWNVRAAARGAILHDLTYYDWHDPARWHRPHGFKHPGFALKNARELNKEITPLEENIILRHMWPLTPIPPKYKEAWLVSMADKYCASREMLIAENARFRKNFTVHRKMLEK